MKNSSTTNIEIDIETSGIHMRQPSPESISLRNLLHVLIDLDLADFYYVVSNLGYEFDIEQYVKRVKCGMKK